MNEEEVKTMIVLPWLAELGVPASDLSFETTFSVRVGRQTCSISPDFTARGRLDILVRRKGRNLLVIEVKRSDVALTDADREQAISYARLVHPIAPFALVTNGTDFQLFDSLSMERIEPRSTTFQDGYSLVLPERARMEALRLFFSCSPANLLVFCRAQVDLEMRPLIGGLLDYSASYIPELHIDRSEWTMPVVQSFLESDRSTFLLVADAAMGKTCAMVDIAKQLLDRNVPVLFFRGAMLETDILDAIDREVEWAYGRTAGSVETLHRLASSAEDKRVVVVVDGIDDWGHASRVQHLASLVAHLRPEHVQLLLSCKTDSWPLFLQFRGAPTRLESHVYLASRDQPFSLELPNFTEREFVSAVQKCRKAFPAPGAFDEGAWSEARRNPFLLRLLFQVASASNARFLGLDTAFFETYFDLVLQKTSNPEAAAHTVDATANILFETNQEWVAERVVRERLRLGVNEGILPDLFEQRILTGVGSPGQRQISFGFAPFRNYVTAFRSRRWPQATVDRFTADIAEGDSAGLRTEIATFYYPFAPEEQKRSMDGPLRQNATAFIRFYSEAITRHFGAFRRQFAPFTNGRIGFVAEFSLARRRLGLYGFRAISGQDEEVLFVPASKDGRTHKLMLLDASRMHYHSATKGFQSLDVSPNVLHHEICPQLREIVQKGRLSDAATPALAEDVIRSAIRSHKSIFGSLLDASGLELRYPVALTDVEALFRRETLRRHFEDELVDHKRSTGEIQETWQGTTVSFNWTLSQTDRAKVMARVDAAIATGEQVRSNTTYGDLERLWSRLNPALSDRRQHSDVIEAPSLPGVHTLRKSGAPDYSTFKEHCRAVLELSIANYKRVVEHNFPTLREHFSLYRRLPLSVILVVHPAMLSDAQRWGRCYLVDREGLTDTAIAVYDQDEVSEDGDELRTPGGTVPSWEWSTASGSAFLEGPWINGLELDEPGSIVRRWVYRWLHDDIRQVENALLAEYQVLDTNDSDWI